MPAPPEDITEASQRVWRVWMAGWAASLWTPDDLPGIEHTIRLWDRQLIKMSTAGATALGQWMDRYGLTPKGLQERRWLRPKEETRAPSGDTGLRRLRVVGE